MYIDDILTDDVVLTELGRRLERHRLEHNRTQDQMAYEAGIGRATLQRIERGQSVQLTSMIRLLRALGLLAALDTAVPEALELPMVQLEREQRKTRRRARRGPPRGGGARDGASGHGSAEHPAQPGEPPWSWGDEPEASA